MLNDIRLHLNKNENKQNAIEAQLSKALQQRYSKNIAAFDSYIPNIGAQLRARHLQSMQLFVDKNAQVNLVNISTGKTFYHLDVDTEIQKQLSNYSQHSCLLNLDKPGQNIVIEGEDFDGFKTYCNKLSEHIAQSQIDALVMLGLGKGAHVSSLVEQTSPQVLIIYEPSWDVFQASLFAIDWQGLLEVANARNLPIFLQVGKDASDLANDIGELRTAISVNTALIYKHYNHPVFDAIMQLGRYTHFDLLALQGQKITASQQQVNFEHIIQTWTPSFDIAQWESVKQDNEAFQENLEAFGQYFPDIHSKFENYESRYWQVIKHKRSQAINLFHVASCTVLNSETAKDSASLLAQHYANHPNQDGLIFGYNKQKLKFYCHNTFIERAANILKGLESETASLSKDIKSLVIFGTESGYIVNHLLKTHKVENLFISEPNPDFFYASLFAINWRAIFEDIDASERRIYINVGEASSQLYADINAQFMVLGPHLLNETYFLQTYQNSVLDLVIKDVRDQLRITFSLSENIDHVIYGMTHTRHALAQKIPVMAKDAPKRLSKATRNLPLFIVGNGASLDNTINELIQVRDKVLVVSCGTALQALYQYGVTPDFHAEVEQCRATFDWPSRIADFDYLKKITLVSINGIHPDTCALYKNTLMAFKAGESSTLSAFAMLGKDFSNKTFATLKTAFPTVANLALNFFLELGFNNIYLMGVDLGFVDYDKHHSAKSGYYEQGKEILNYRASVDKGLPTCGNFRDTVYTKAEFHISRLILEQTLSAYKADCYNLSDGVLIKGASPLAKEDVFIINDDIPREALEKELNNAFITIGGDIHHMYEEAFNQTAFTEQLSKLHQICLRDIAQPSDIHEMIEDCREHLHNSIRRHNSFFGYWFFGSVNYFCATLGKTLQASNELEAIQAANRIRDAWLLLLNDIQSLDFTCDSLLDSATSFPEKREKVLYQANPINLVCSNQDLLSYIEACLPSFVEKTDSFDAFQDLSKAKRQARINNAPTIILLSTIAEVLSLKQHENALRELTHHSNLMLVYTNAKILPFLENFVAELKLSKGRERAIDSEKLCLCYITLTPYSEKEDSAYQRAYGIRAPLLDKQIAVDFLLARAADIERYSHIFYKPRFDKSGSDSARLSFEEASSRASDAATSLNSARTKPYRDNFNNGATDYLGHVFSSLLSKAYAYNFYPYIGFCEEKHGQTIVDSLANRGLLVSRALEPFELLGNWYKQDKAQEIRLTSCKEQTISV
uniref:motility associated factor glycosyltransferase family protein n=1 Tax=Ningiella ruwaisensis TaxID=2364274 RepID=UPI00109FA7CF|nr:6-hydroxymethylpterin diphosphokinase MptE-like protein [Ningiella ruwaisensis]